MKKIKINKRAAEGLTMNKLIILILVVLTILLVIIIWKKPAFLDFFRNLPGFQGEQEDVIIPDVSTDQQIVSQSYKVGRVLEATEIVFCINEGCSKVISSNLYLDGDKKEGSIYVNDPTIFRIDEKIGEIKDYKINMDDEVLEKRGKIYEEAKDRLPDSKYLQNLENAHISVYENIIYRDKQVVNSEVGGK